MKNNCRLLLFAFSLLGLVSCGGSSGGSKKNVTSSLVTQTPKTENPENPRPVVAGNFIASAQVGGIRFVAESQHGVTSSLGAFSCEENNSIQFYLDNSSDKNIFLGELSCQSLVSPFELVSNSINSLTQGLGLLTGELRQKVINMFRLLESLDFDNNYENGILISSDTLTAVEQFLEENSGNVSMSIQEMIALDSEEFSQELLRLLTAIGRPESLVSESEIIAHLMGTSDFCVGALCLPSVDPDNSLIVIPPVSVDLGIVDPVVIPEIEIPAITIPAINTPIISTPEIVVGETPLVLPEVTLSPNTNGLPSVSTPGITVPEVTLPGISTPIITTPGLVIPEIVVPEIDLTSGTIPAIMVPSITVPEISTPIITIPAITIPTITTPEINIPLIGSLPLPDVPLPNIALTPVSLPNIGFNQQNICLNGFTMMGSNPLVNVVDSLLSPVFSLLGLNNLGLTQTMVVLKENGVAEFYRRVKSGVKLGDLNIFSNNSEVILLKGLWSFNQNTKELLVEKLPFSNGLKNLVFEKVSNLNSKIAFLANKSSGASSQPSSFRSDLTNWTMNQNCQIP